MIVRLVCSLVAAAALLLSQDARGRISGRVADPSGASIAGATITATRAETAVGIETKTSEEGVYELPLLQPGIYKIEVQTQGFKRYTRDSFVVRAGERLTLDITLEVGAVTESINVSGQAALVETGTATIGNVVDQRRLLELPLPGGNAFSLARLSAGVINLGSPNHPSLGPAVEVVSNLSVNGVRPGNIEFTIDGAPSMWGTNASYVPPADIDRKSVV